MSGVGRDRGWRTALTGRWFVPALGAVVVTQLAVVAWLLSRSYFIAEDFGQLATYPDEPLGWDLLRTSVFGHFIPGLVLAQRVAGGWLGGSWAATSALTCVIQVAGTVAFARLLVALSGRRWWVPWLTAAYALGVVGLNTAPWWAATLAPQVAVVASISTFGCALRYARDHRARHLVALAVVFTVAVAFFEKSIAVSAYLGLFVLLVGTGTDDGWSDRARAVLRLWPAWAVLAAVSAADLVVYLTGDYLSEAGEPASVGKTLEYLARVLPEGVFPSLAGASYPSSVLPGPDPLTPVVATVIVVGVMAWTSLRSGLAARAWLWFLLATAASQVLVARGRLTLMGSEAVVTNLRYQVDPAWLFLVALAVAGPAAARTVGPRARLRIAVAGALAPLLVLPLWVQTLHSISTDSPGTASRAYFSVLRDGDLPDGAAFLDLAVPGYVVPAPMYPWNLASTVYPVVRPGVTTTHDPDGALWVAPDGSVGTVGLADVSTPTSPGCVGTGHPPVEVVPPDAAARAGVGPPLLLALHHEADGDASVRVLLGTSAADAERYGPPVTVRGSGDLAVPIAPAAGDAVYVEVREHGEECLSDVRLTRPQ